MDLPSSTNVDQNEEKVDDDIQVLETFSPSQSSGNDFVPRLLNMDLNRSFQGLGGFQHSIPVYSRIERLFGRSNMYNSNRVGHTALSTTGLGFQLSTSMVTAAPSVALEDSRSGRTTSRTCSSMFPVLGGRPTGDVIIGSVKNDDSENVGISHNTYDYYSLLSQDMELYSLKNSPVRSPHPDFHSYCYCCFAFKTAPFDLYDFPPTHRINFIEAVNFRLGFSTFIEGKKKLGARTHGNTAAPQTCAEEYMPSHVLHGFCYCCHKDSRHRLPKLFWSNCSVVTSAPLDQTKAPYSEPVASVSEARSTTLLPSGGRGGNSKETCSQKKAHEILDRIFGSEGDVSSDDDNNDVVIDQSTNCSNGLPSAAHNVSQHRTSPLNPEGSPSDGNSEVADVDPLWSPTEVSDGSYESFTDFIVSTPFASSTQKMQNRSLQKQLNNTMAKFTALTGPIPKRRKLSAAVSETVVRDVTSCNNSSSDQLSRAESQSLLGPHFAKLGRKKDPPATIPEEANIFFREDGSLIRLICDMCNFESAHHSSFVRHVKATHPPKGKTILIKIKPPTARKGRCNCMMHACPYISFRQHDRRGHLMAFHGLTNDTPHRPSPNTNDQPPPPPPPGTPHPSTRRKSTKKF